MKRNIAGRKGLALVATGVALVFCDEASAVQGSILDAYGVQSAGMGGASIALPQDPLVVVNNPAGMALLGNQFNFDFQVLAASVQSTFGSPNNTFTTYPIAPIPEGGVNYQIAPQWTVGVAAYGYGAASDYGRPVAPIPGLDSAKARLAQYNVAPTVTYTPVPTLSLGASLIIGYETFLAQGIPVVVPGQGVSAMPSHGTKSAFGIGFGVGVVWKPVDWVTLGGSYYSKVKYEKLSGYDQDLFADVGGHADQPERFGLGIAVRPLSPLILTFDWMRILWSSAPAFSSSATFGWKNQNVYSVGASYELTPVWTVRTGFRYGTSPLDSDYTNANFYAPGINNKSITGGVSYKLSPKSEVSASFIYSIPRTVVGTGPSTGTNIHANAQYYGIGYAQRF